MYGRNEIFAMNYEEAGKAIEKVSSLLERFAIDVENAGCPMKVALVFFYVQEVKRGVEQLEKLNDEGYCASSLLCLYLEQLCALYWRIAATWPELKKYDAGNLKSYNYKLGDIAFREPIE